MLIIILSFAGLSWNCSCQYLPLRIALHIWPVSMKLIFIFLFLLFCPYFAQLQTLHYDLYTIHKHIGELTVTETSKDDKLIIDINCEVKISMGLALHVKYLLHSVFKNKKLLKANVESFVNKKKHSDSQIEQKGSRYKVCIDDDNTFYPDPIEFSGSMLYFHEPLNVHYVFSEIDGIDKSITKTGTNSYELENPENGQISRYIYKDGVLQKLSVQHALFTFDIILKSDSSTAN